MQIPAPLYTQLARLARQHGARRLVLFGSRARGDFGPRSDIDLAVYGMPPERRGLFWADAEELPTLLELDIVHIMDGMDPVFLQNIEKDGVPLMLTKVEHFCQAVDRLREALDVLAGDPGSTVIRDGVIQRFEFSFELAWKSLRDYMADQGADMSGVVFPKQVLKAAYAAGLLPSEEVWLQMLEARNITSHVYDDQQAAKIAADIRDSYLPALSGLAAHYRETANG